MRPPRGDVVLIDPVGNVVPTVHAPHGNAVHVLERNTEAGVQIDAETVTPRWYGDPLDTARMPGSW